MNEARALSSMNHTHKSLQTARKPATSQLTTVSQIYIFQKIIRFPAVAMASKLGTVLLSLALLLALRGLAPSFLGGTARVEAPRAPRSSVARQVADDDEEPGFSWDGEKPDLPTSPEEMAQQAADAVMRAYRDGKTRQAMRLRLDELFDMESLYIKGIQSLQLATQPFMEGMAKKLWGGDFLKEVKTSVVDDQAGTLIYRESDNELQDIAMFYLPGRDLMADQKTQNFLQKMKDRFIAVSYVAQGPQAVRGEATFVRPLTLVAELRCRKCGNPGVLVKISNMAEGEGFATSSAASGASFVSNQIAALVPTFDPSKDDLQVYSQKVFLLLEAWPEGKYTELATRLILNCSGSAFMKLQLHQTELMVNEKKSIKRIIEILGGHWGQISLEKRYEYAERALYKCTQRPDETADSFLARADIMWTELNSRSLKLSDLQAYVTLRGSTLSPEDKKKVLIDADSAGSGDLSIQKVGSAIRLLGAGFFQDVTGQKRTKLKTYDQATLAMEDVEDESHEGALIADSEIPEDEMLEVFVADGDDDAIFITDFENAAAEIIQGDQELAAALTSYTDARKRLNEKMRYRGFWPVSNSKGKGSFKGKTKGKFQKGHNSSRKSLEQRILSSRCRICNKVGHWKAECPDRPNRSPAATAPTTFVSADASLPMENDVPDRKAPEPSTEEPALFATHGSLGVVDLGATKTVIGSDLVADLIQSLHPNIRKKLSRCPCNVTFRFGNHGTLKSEQALVVPLPSLLLKVAIVPGSTPFLISNTLLRAFQAVIDVEKHVMWSKKFNRAYPLQLTQRGLFLIDLNDLAEDSARTAADSIPAETHLAEESVSKSADPEMQVRAPVMPSLAERLQSIQVQAVESVPDLPKYSIAEMDEMTVDFGTKHNGRRYLDVWNSDQAWVLWFVKHYGSSQKKSHRLMVQYIDAKVERAAGREKGLGDRTRGLPISGPWEALDRGPEQSQSQGSSHAADRNSSRSPRAAGLGDGRCRTVCRDGDELQCPSPDRSPHECGGEHLGRHPPAPRADSIRPTTTECLQRRIVDESAHSDMTGLFAAGEPCHDCYHAHDLSSHTCEERKRFHMLVSKYEQELMSLAAETMPKIVPSKKLDLLEVFCGPNSQLTHQCKQLGYQAVRLGYAQCDLQSKEGRTILFQHVLQQQPENVWFSPSCGPWSGWSTLNGSKSMQAWDDLQQSRMKHLEQIALGLVILRHQHSQGRHFHWEQSQASLMFKLPYLAEVHHYTKAAEIDMCTAGDLRDPESNKFIKKGLSILTTSQRVLDSLKNKKCSGMHEHQVIEGSVKVGQHRMNRSTFSEHYPRKFARDMAKVLCQHRFPKERPFWYDSCLHVSPALVSEPALKRRRLIVQAKPKLSRSSEMTASTVVKRRKLNGKQPVESALDSWTKVFDQVDGQLPRVGKVEIFQGTILQELQALMPDMHVKFAIACRGSSRTIAPPKQTVHGEAPYRKCAYLQRGTTKIFVEDQWENWEMLSQRQRVRPSHQCRINITVFACNPPQDQTANQHVPAASESSPAQPSDAIPLLPDESRNLEVPDVQSNEPSGPVMPDSTSTPPSSNSTGTETSNIPDSGPQPITVNQHALFQRLPKHEQQLVAKIHKNLGHPSNERLCTLMLQQGFRPEMIQAARHFQCSTCVQCSQPKHARPSSIKDDLDFNDRISIDGVQWTSSGGQSFHLYHVVDWATNFHMANVAPSRTTEDAIAALMNMWISWAGVPGEILVDAASEFNSESFAQFLQEHNIRSTTISPEAHFQNGKAERHGAILQHMLDKFHVEHPINNYADFQRAVWWCVQSKNACSLKRGFAPEVLVLGKHTRLPGAVSSDILLPAHFLADSETAQGLRFRQQLACRETARRAFHSADNSAALRRAMLRRSNPHRGTYQPGEWVMSWREGHGQNPGYWQGPMKVVVHENQYTVWATMASKLYRIAPEHVRPVTSEEAQGIIVRSDEPSSAEIAKQIPRNPEGGITRIIQADPLPAPLEVPPVPVPVNAPDVNVPESNSSAQEEQPDVEPEAAVPTTPDEHSREHIDTPVPEESDDDLICEGLFCQDADVNALDETVGQYAWKSEILVSSHDIENWKSDPDPEAMTFLVSAAKKQRSEVRLSELTMSEREEFVKAKDAEITNWLKTGTVQKMFRHQLSPEQILRCRWILTWKPIEASDIDPKQPDKMHRAKARLVVLGYLDPKITEIPRDSPTLNRLSKMLILQLIASRSWDLRSFDIKAAFLQGRPQQGRVIGIEPVPELAKRLQLGPDQICQLTKSAYGLIDAPFLWYQALRDELLKLGFETSPFCPCTFILRNPDTKEPDGIIGVHVDDGLCGGNKRFLEKLRELEQKYPFGSQKLGNFTFTGIDMFQHPNKSITMSQAEYVKKIAPIKIPSERRAREDAEVTPEERLALRGLIGSLQYAAVHTRPDLSSRLSFLQSDINKATVQTLLEANKTLHEAKRHSEVSVTIQPIQCQDLRFLAFSDASFSSKKVPDSHTGCMIMSTHKDIERNTTCPVNPISWGCKKIQRVVTSTLAAETVSLSSVLDQLSWIRLCWAWMLNPAVKWQQPEQALKDLPQSFSTATVNAQNLPTDLAATDCKSLFDLVTRTATPNCSEFRTMLNAKKIKEMLEEGISLRWVASGAQLADSLTKIMDNSFLRETLMQGQYRLNDELEILKQRANARNRLKWLRSNCQGNDSNESLVLLVNTENAQSFWRPDYQGMDWGDYTNMGKEISNMFKEQTYYYDKAPFQSWQMTTFRAYPYNWEIFIEDLDYNLVKIFDSDYKPTSNQIVARLEQYEQMNSIPAYKKMAKIMKDTMKQEEASEKVEPGWRSSASPEEIVKRQEAAQERAREEAAKWEQKEGV
eukprot:s1370_g4.t1